MRALLCLALLCVPTAGLAAGTNSMVGLLTDKLMLPTAKVDPRGALPDVNAPHVIVTQKAVWWADNGQSLQKATQLYLTRDTDIHDPKMRIDALFDAVTRAQAGGQTPVVLLDTRLPQPVRMRVFATLTQANANACVAVAYGRRAHCAGPIEYRQAAGELFSPGAAEHTAAGEKRPGKAERPVTSKKAAAAAGLSEAHVKAVMRKYEPRVQQCYRKKLVHRTRLKGKLVMRVVVGSTGKVVEVGVKRDFLKDGDVAACVIDVLYDAQFNRRGTGTIEITYPFTFKS